MRLSILGVYRLGARNTTENVKAALDDEFAPNHDQEEDLLIVKLEDFVFDAISEFRWAMNFRVVIDP